MNNGALASLNSNLEETNKWGHIKNLAFNDKTWRDVIISYKFKKLLNPILPMTPISKMDFERMKRLSKQFKSKFPEEASSSCFLDYTQIKVPVDSNDSRKRRVAIRRNHKSMLKHAEADNYSNSSGRSNVDIAIPDLRNNDVFGQKDSKKKKNLIPRYFKSHIIRESKNF